MKTNFTKTKIKNILLKTRFLKTLKQTAFILMGFGFTFIIIGGLIRISLPTNTIVNNELIEKVEAKEIKTKKFIYSKEAAKADLKAIKENRESFLKNNKKVIHLGLPEDDKRQKWLQYAYKKSGYDKDFILTIIAENYQVTTTRPSNIVGANGYKDYGICQVNAGYHPEILRKKGYHYPDNRYFAEWFLDPYKQIDYCIKLYKGGTKFYGYNVRHRVKKYLKFN